jgi:hexokinase
MFYLCAARAVPRMLCSSADLSGATAALGAALGVALQPAAVALVKEVCHLVTRRAARLSAAGVVAVLTHMGVGDAAGKPPTVAVDGGAWGKAWRACLACRVTHAHLARGAGLFEHHTVFAAMLREAVAQMGVSAVLRLTPDGSGVGAALLAAAAAAQA